MLAVYLGERRRHELAPFLAALAYQDAVVRAHHNYGKQTYVLAEPCVWLSVAKHLLFA